MYGESFAKENGYTLSSYSGNKQLTTYSKHFGDDVIIYATFDGREDEMKLERIVGLVSCTINNISNPNKNLHSFESQLIRLVQISS